MPLDAAEMTMTAATARAMPMAMIAVWRLRRVMPRRTYSNIALLTGFVWCRVET